MDVQQDLARLTARIQQLKAEHVIQRRELYYRIRSQVEQERLRYPRMRIHKMTDLQCELCTKHFRTGGSELHICQSCGVDHEGSDPDCCHHCTNGESPSWENLDDHPDLRACQTRIDEWEVALETQLGQLDIERQNKIQELAYIRHVFPKLRQHPVFDVSCRKCWPPDDDEVGTECVSCGIVGRHVVFAVCAHCSLLNEA